MGRHLLRSLVLLLTTLALFVGSCSSGAAPTPPAPTPTPAVRATASGAPAGEALEAAYALLLTTYIEPVSSAKLLTAALDGVSAELVRAGVISPTVERPPFTDDPKRDWELFRAAFANVSARYGSKLPSGALTHAAVRKMADSVDDCHTSFFDPAQYAEQMRWFRGEVRFGGIGAALRKPKREDPLVIWRVFDDGPAAKAGLRAGDIVVSVDGQDVSDLTVDAAVQLIRGREGAPVTLTVRRGIPPQTINLTITRATIDPPAVEARVYQGGIGFLLINSFPVTVVASIDRALGQLQQAGIRALVIDLRNNGGGSLDAQNQALSRFIKQGLLFYLFDRSGQRTNFSADGQSYRGLRVPITVMVNEGTGSGGELFAAALQEHGLAVTVGARTAGCVGTGRVFNLPDGSGLQLTVGRVLTGQRNRILNRIGLTPDYEVALTVDDLVAGRDPQLERAFQLLAQYAER